MRAEETCKAIIDRLLTRGFRLQVTRKDLEDAIRLERDCVDERTILRWIKALESFGYIKRKAPDVYMLSGFKIPKLISLLKENNQSKLF